MFGGAGVGWASGRVDCETGKIHFSLAGLCAGVEDRRRWLGGSSGGTWGVVDHVEALEILEILGSNVLLLSTKGQTQE